jgi:hypothetical protein
LNLRAKALYENESAARCREPESPWKEGVDGSSIAWLLRTIRSVAPDNVEDGQRIEIARMQQLLAERD